MTLATVTATATDIRFAAATSGRPQPWLALGLSERTYYRRKAAGALDAPPPPEQQAAHVLAWFATLDVFAQLDHRAKVRRWERDARKAAREERAEHDVLKLYTSLKRVLH